MAQATKQSSYCLRCGRIEWTGWDDAKAAVQEKWTRSSLRDPADD